MARTAHRTSSTTNQGAKLTDYFMRSPAGGTSSSRTKNAQQQAKSQEVGRKPKASEATRGSKREVISVSSDSHVSVSSGSVIYVSKSSKGRMSRLRPSPEEASPPCVKQRASARPYISEVSPSIISKAREVLGPYTSESSPDTSKMSAKRKKKFETDSDVEYIDKDKVIYVPKVVLPKSVTTQDFHQSFSRSAPNEVEVPSKTRTPPKKKQRLSTSTNDPSSVETADLVPSSQSDEREFTPFLKAVTKSVEEVTEIVERWRETTLAPADDLLSAQEQPTSFDAETSHANSSFPGAEGDAEITTTEDWAPSLGRSDTMSDDSPVHTFPCTPPGDGSSSAQIQFGMDASLPLTPVALDAEAKTAQIIAQIKANAFQARFSSPENITLPDFPDLEDSDDDSDDILPDWGQRVANVDRPPPGPFSSPLSSIPSPIQQRESAHSPSPFRYSLRSRGPLKLAAAIQLEERAGSAATASGKLLSNLVAKKQIPDDRVQNPLDALLKDKRQAQKTGKDSEALRRAEDAVEDWTNEEAALAAVLEGRGMSFNYDDSIFGSPSGSANGSLPESEDRKRLLGGDREKEISIILFKDKRTQLARPAKVSGIYLWTEDLQKCDRVETTSELPSWSSSAEDVHPFVKDLRSAVEGNQTPYAVLLMNSGVLAAPLSLTGLTYFLLDLALSVHTLAEIAFTSLLHHLEFGPPSNVPLSIILKILFRYGAKLSVFEHLDWPVADVPDQKITYHARAKIVDRIVTILNIAARTRSLSYTEFPDFLMVLHLFAIDPLTGIDTRRDLMIAVDVICQSLDGVADDVREIEVQICNKLLQFASDLTPINLSLFLSSFAGGGSPRTRKIARWLAHRMVLQDYHMTLEQYSDLPPLLDIIELLSLSLESTGLFSTYNSTDYEDLGYYVNILSVALSDIDGYVAEESQYPSIEISASQDAGIGSPKKGKPLQVIQRNIEKINSRIVDTRAAHLERSRTKAALQRLAIRVYYQRLAALNAGDCLSKPRTLLNWIKK